MTEIRIGAGQVYTGRIGEPDTWRHIGYTVDGAVLTVEGEPGYELDRRVWSLAGRETTVEFKVTRRNRRAMEMIFGRRYWSRRNRRRNPLHAVRDQLRHERRWRRAR